MPITDAYVLEFLLAATEARVEPLAWRELGAKQVAEVNGVSLELFQLSSLASERLCLTLSCDGNRAWIEQPLQIAFFRRGYRSEDDRRLAALFDALARAVVAKRPNLSTDSRAAVRQELFKRLLFSEVRQERLFDQRTSGLPRGCE
jgi:hypothetical protein